MDVFGTSPAILKQTSRVGGRGGVVERGYILSAYF